MFTVEYKRIFLTGFLAVVFCCGAYGASPVDTFDALAQPSAALDDNTPIEVDAEQLDYDKANARITASGNVVITCGLDELHADRVLVNMNTGDAYALGNVVLKRGASETRGSKLQYNFRTRVCSLDDPEVNAAPFKVLADKVTRAGKNEYVLHRAKVTTCVYKHPHSHFHIRAKRITVVPGEHMKTKGAFWYFGRVPCLWMPYWRRNLAEDSGFRIYPGYRSKAGAYLLTSYFYSLSDTVRAEHHFDYRTKRGFAVGEDVKWNTPTSSGKLNLYYADDQEPLEDDEDPDLVDVDNQRYRIHLQHSQTFDPRTLLLLKLNYLSDTEVLEDFFDREHRLTRQPENYATLSHRRDAYTLTALATVRLNDFYSNLNRLPEASIDVMRLQLGKSSLYYEGQTAVAQLEQVWAEGSGVDDYSSMRLDTGHTIFQPRRYLGWLNLVPRVGYRGTYYSDTITTTTSDSIVTTTSTNTTVESGVTNTVISTTTSTNTTTDMVDAGAQLRNMFEVGAEVSFKAFKTWGRQGGERRHIVEPYANYTLRFEPNIEPVELYQFDYIDALDKGHQVLLGVRNKFQAKREGRPFDLADVNTFTVLELDTEGEEEMFESLFLDAEFRPNTWLSIDLDGMYSVKDSVIEQFNTRFDLIRDDMWSARVEHRYRNEDSNLLAGHVTFYPNARWALNVFGRYEFEESRVEEQGGFVQRKLDCLGIRLGASVLPGYTRSDGFEEDDEFRLMLEFWLTAFPELSVRTRQKY